MSIYIEISAVNHPSITKCKCLRIAQWLKDFQIFNVKRSYYMYLSRAMVLDIVIYFQSHIQGVLANNLYINTTRGYIRLLDVCNEINLLLKLVDIDKKLV